jgi:hypothetical protein
MARKILGFAAFDRNGFQVGTFRARAAADVRRALEIEWGAEAGEIRVERVPVNTVGVAPEFYGERFYDLTGNEGWASLIDAKEVAALAAA